MVNKLVRGFKTPQAAEAFKQDPNEVRDRYRHWQGRMFYASFIGYALFYFCRNNISAALPVMAKDLGYTNTQLGWITTALTSVYAFGKFGNGILSDRANIRVFMAFGLLASAVANVFFGLSSGLYLLAALWAMNGWFQSMGWPPCAKILTNWYGRRQRGTIWGLWSASHQVGGAGVLFLAGWLAEHHGWRSAFLVPAAIGAAGAAFLFERLRDRPVTLGLPPIEIYSGELQVEEHAALLEKPSVRRILVDEVLKKPAIWLLSVQNLFVYIVRWGCLIWSVKFLVEAKGSHVGSAAYKTAILEIMGIFGGIAAGWLSDRWFKRYRSRLNFFYLLFLAGAVYLFWWVPGDNTALQITALSLIGFLVYGPQMLVGGPCTVDFCSTAAAGTATGFVGLFGYFGAMWAGAGIGFVIDKFGWFGAFGFLTACALLAAGISVFLWKAEPKTP